MKIRMKRLIIKYQDLKREIKKLWSISQQKVVLAVAAALGAVNKSTLDTWLDMLRITIRMGLL